MKLYTYYITKIISLLLMTFFASISVFAWESEHQYSEFEHSYKSNYSVLNDTYLYLNTGNQNLSNKEFLLNQPIDNQFRSDKFIRDKYLLDDYSLLIFYEGDFDEKLNSANLALDDDLEGDPNNGGSGIGTIDASINEDYILLLILSFLLVLTKTILLLLNKKRKSLI